MPKQPRHDQQRRQQEEKGQRSSSGAPEHSLKEREYRDADGGVHHHTNTWEEQHRGEERR